MKSELLPHLETFAKAAELSSFTAAARALGLSQAAVSQRVQSLEQSLAASLFHRQGGHIMLTEAGQKLYGFAQRILALHQEARREITGKTEPLSAELSLAASSIPGEHLLPDLLTQFRQKHPHVHIRASVSDSAAVAAQVEQGEVQLGLVGGKGAGEFLEYRSFAHDRMALIVPAEHPLTRPPSPLPLSLRGRGVRGEGVSLEQLGEQPLILRETGSGSRSCLEQALARSGKSLRDLRVALELGSNEAIKEMILRGGGLSVLSTHTVKDELAAGTLQALPIAGLDLERELFVVWDKRRVLSIPAQLFLAFLKDDPRQPTS